MYGADADAERVAFAWLLGKAQELGSEAAVITPGVDNIDALSRVLGHHAAYAKQHRELVVDGITVRFFSPRTQPSSFAGPVLVMWADTSMVEAAERLGPPALCATGWSQDGLDDWKRSWAPVDPRTGKTDGEKAQVPNAVQGAVDSLSGPLGNDVVHPMDKKRAVNAFRALHMRGVPIDPTIMRMLAIQEGWAPDAADRLSAIARGLAEGRPVRGGDKLNQTKAKQLVERFEAGGD